MGRHKVLSLGGVIAILVLLSIFAVINRYDTETSGGVCRIASDMHQIAIILLAPGAMVFFAVAMYCAFVRCGGLTTIFWLFEDHSKGTYITVGVILLSALVGAIMLGAANDIGTGCPG
jgi:hypothetical protein